LRARDECWEDWEGFCFDLADAASQWWDKRGVHTHAIWIEPFLGYKYHAALFHRGRVHDSLHGSPLLLRNYFRAYDAGQTMIAEHIIDTDFVIRQRWLDGELLSQTLASFEEEQMFDLEGRDFVGRCTNTISQIDLMGFTLGHVGLQDNLNIGEEDRKLLDQAKDEILALRQTLAKLRDRGMTIYRKAPVGAVGRGESGA
jgi:hypothetical protein